MSDSRKRTRRGPGQELGRALRRVTDIALTTGFVVLLTAATAGTGGRVLAQPGLRRGQRAPH